MPTLRNKDGQEFEVSDVDAVNMAKADPSLEVVGDVRTAPGEYGQATVSMSSQSVLTHAGQAPASEEQIAAASRDKFLEGKTSTIGALARGAISGATLGLSDYIADPDVLEADQAHHAFASGIGQLAGAFAPGLIGDESGIAGLIARDPVSVEHAAGSLSSKFLYAGNVGKESSLLERGLAEAGGHVEAAKAAMSVPEELGSLDAAGLRAAEEGELGKLGEQQAAKQAALRSEVVSDAQALHSQTDDANLFLATREGPANAAFTKSTNRIRNALDNTKAVERNPGQLLDALERQEKALVETIGERDAIASKLAKNDSKIASSVAEDLGGDVGGLLGKAESVDLEGKAARRYGAWADVKIKGKNPTITVAGADAEKFVQALQSGEAAGETSQALGKLDSVLEANRALQEKVKLATAKALPKSELASERLTQIRAARDALASPAGKSLGEEMLGGAIMGHVAGALSGLPIIGHMVGAKAGQLAKDLVFGRMGKTVAAGTQKTKDAIGAFLNVAKRATPTLPIAATRVLADARFSPSATAPAKGAKLPELFKQRTDEIKSQTAYGPDGKPQIRPEARQAIANRLAPVMSGSPILADKLETEAVRRLEYLSSIIPRRPDIGGLPVGPDNWQPSSMQMREFARSVAVAEDPHDVERRLATGNIAPEEAACYHAVYPERAEAIKQTLLQQMPTMRQTLPYARRLSLSIFSGVAVDPSLEPAVLQVLQAQFEAEEGSEQGTQAPQAKPQFGSVRADIGTASQQREAGMK